MVVQQFSSCIVESVEKVENGILESIPDFVVPNGKKLPISLMFEGRLRQDDENDDDEWQLFVDFV